MSFEHPTEGEVVGAAVRLYNIVVNYAVDHPDRLPEKLMDYWDPELWDIAERVGRLVGVEVSSA